jgi:hypothetical protein
MTEEIPDIVRCDEERHISLPLHLLPVGKKTLCPFEIGPFSAVGIMLQPNKASHFLKEMWKI